VSKAGDKIDFDELSRFETIVVTGPQRSGTTICAKIIAHELGYDYIDENEFGVHEFHRFLDIVENGLGKVLQCPGLSRYVHLLSCFNDTVIVFMKRDINDIIASQERIAWGKNELRELEMYGYDFGCNIPVAEIKYGFWNYQKGFLKDWIEVEYESLSEHPLWIPKERRVGFKPRQVTEEG